MRDLILLEPSKALEKAAMDFRQEHIDRGEDYIHGSCGFMRHSDYDEWLKRVALWRDAETSPLNVPSDTYFSLRKSDNKIIGTIQLRHYLTEKLEKSGGHIGYGVRPSERGKGYGTRQLALVLEKAKALGISRVMISCDKDNPASAKTAMKNGGVLTREGLDDKGIEEQTYWIEVL